jgi:serine/threonine protein kinase
MSESPNSICALSEPPFADLFDELTSRLQAGEPLDLEAYLGEHPEHAEQLRHYLPAIEVLVDLGRSAAQEVGTSAPGLADPVSATGHLGDYRIVREVGRGGMGVVYEAEQVSLGRRVALKVLPFAATLDARQLRRFKNEAQAAACLHHAHIVPVYGVGCERGVHYYAMQFIEGRTLAEVIGELRNVASGHTGDARAATGSSTDPVAALSTERSITTPGFFQAVARLGVQAAEALEHAHQMGVLHRDVKPANLLLDAAGQLWVTDFGLARCRAEQGLTLSGDLVGTLRYMSPEQALAKRDLVDHRSDLYSLGATLYELLTLQPAYPGTDREELLHQIAQGEPRSPRRLNAKVPVELETIVLKAMAREPAGRYETAQELADDLRRFLEHRPIQARRPSLRERLAKWTVRHRSMVAATAIMAVVAIIGLSISTAVVWYENHQKNNALEQLRQEEAEAQRQRRRAETNFNRALTGTMNLLLIPENEHWTGKPEIEGLRQDLVDEGLKFFEGFVHEDDPDPAIRFESARGLGRMTCVYCALRKLPEARDTMRRAYHLLEGLAAEAPADARYRLELGRQHSLMGLMYWSLKKPPDAEQEFTEAARQYRLGLPYDSSGACANNLAWVLVDCPLVSVREPNEAVVLARKAVAQQPGEGAFWDTLGVALYRCGAHQDAMLALQKSMELRAGGDPNEWLFLAMICWQRGEQGKATDWYERSLQWMKTHQPVDESLMRYKAEAKQLFHSAAP